MAAGRREVAAACLLTAVGGFLDAYSYVDLGGVFANAQSGNVVLLGVELAGLHWSRAARHAPPIAAYFVGVLLTRGVLAGRSDDGGRAAAACLLVEAAGLGLLGVHVPLAVATVVISVMAAIQSASFARVRGWSYNSSVTTGNLRSLARALGDWLRGLNAGENRTKAAVLGLVCAAFLVGAVAGGVSAGMFGRRSVFIAAACVVLVAALLWEARDPRARPS